MPTKKHSPKLPAALYKPGDKIYFLNLQTGKPFLVQGEIFEHTSKTVSVKNDESGKIIGSSTIHLYAVNSPVGPQELAETEIYRTFALGAAAFAKCFLKLL